MISVPAIERDDTGTTYAEVVLKCMARIANLPALRGSAQLPYQFCALRESRGT